MKSQWNLFKILLLSAGIFSLTIFLFFFQFKLAQAQPINPDDWQFNQPQAPAPQQNYPVNPDDWQFNQPQAPAPQQEQDYPDYYQRHRQEFQQNSPSWWQPQTFIQETYYGIQSLSFQDVVRIIGRLANWMFIVLLGVAVIMIIIAAYRYLAAGGDESKVSSAHKTLIYALIAIGIGLLAKGFAFLIAELVGAPPLPRF